MEQTINRSTPLNSDRLALAYHIPLMGPYVRHEFFKTKLKKKYD